MQNDQRRSEIAATAGPSAFCGLPAADSILVCGGVSPSHCHSDLPRVAHTSRGWRCMRFEANGAKGAEASLLDFPTAHTAHTAVYAPPVPSQQGGSFAAALQAAASCRRTAIRSPQKRDARATSPSFSPNRFSPTEGRPQMKDCRREDDCSGTISYREVLTREDVHTCTSIRVPRCLLVAPLRVERDCFSFL